MQIDLTALRVRLYGLRHLRDHASAEDLMQQVLITTLEALRQGCLREPEKLASFRPYDIAAPFSLSWY